jgi:hypothetical protein
MSDEPETFPIALGGKSWELPHFTFGVIRKLQPRLLRANVKYARGAPEELTQRLDEDALEDLLDIVALALRQVEPGLTRDRLDALTFSAADLVVAQIPIMLACGLTLRKPGDAEGAADPKA